MYMYDNMIRFLDPRRSYHLYSIIYFHPFIYYKSNIVCFMFFICKQFDISIPIQVLVFDTCLLF